MMTTILFYAHRGGTGRSLCLANCATELAIRGKDVYVLDLDINAGGLHTIFNFQKKDELFSIDTKAKGLIRCFSNPDEIKNETLKLNGMPPYKGKLKGNLYFLPLLPSPFWLDEIENRDSVKFANTLKLVRQNIMEEYQEENTNLFLLVDLPTGITPIREIFLGMCEEIIMLSRPNIQGARGTNINMKDLSNRGIEPIFVLSCVPNPIKKKTRHKISEFQREAGLDSKAINFIIPFDNDMAFFEDIPVISRPKSSISKIYKEIVNKLI